MPPPPNPAIPPRSPQARQSASAHPSAPLTRRQLHRAALALALAPWLRPAGAAGGAAAGPPAPGPQWLSDPFALGIASGQPRPDGMVLWTRLAPEAVQKEVEKTGPAACISWVVSYQIYSDEQLLTPMRQGQVVTDADRAHSVHALISGLPPGRPYWYRFSCGSAQSPVGRTRTAPAAHAEVARLRFALASCQNYEQGWFAAHRELARQELDFVLFVGDYIYESVTQSRHKAAPGLREHSGGAPARTLDDYRARHAQYKRDPDLQAAHAAHPWICTWDDHEVSNDYAGDIDPVHMAEGQAAFLQRRAAAYQAYFEHMPLALPGADAGFGFNAGVRAGEGVSASTRSGAGISGSASAGAGAGASAGQGAATGPAPGAPLAVPATATAAVNAAAPAPTTADTPASATAAAPHADSPWRHPRIHDRYVWGQLAELWTLDCRQYRSPQACQDPARGGGRAVLGCDTLADPARTMLGAEQEHWLYDGLRASRRQWKLIAQATQISPTAVNTPLGRATYTDAWDGYPAARQRLLQTLADARITDVVTLGGDVHMNVAADLRLLPGDAASPIVASEIVGTSISSRGLGETLLQHIRASNPDLHHARADQRGYTLVDVTPQRVQVTFRTTPHPVAQDAAFSTQARFAIERGKAGVRPVD